MTQEEIVALVVSEFQTPTLGVTEQYLEVHAPVTENGTIKIDRIDWEAGHDRAIVYVPVVDEFFHFALLVNLKLKKVYGFRSEPWHRVYFNATSKTLSLQELQSCTSLIPTSGWDKEDLRPHGKNRYGFSSFKLLPNPEPDTFENKLTKLLDRLETDPEGVKKLAEKTKAEITVAINFHNGNGMLGGLHLDQRSLQRIAELNFSMDFDLYAEGHPFGPPYVKTFGKL